MERALVNVEDLAMLVRVVDSGGVTRAAEALHVAQAAVTQRLRRLERVLGTPLVERRGRSLLTSDEARLGHRGHPLSNSSLATSSAWPAY